MFGCLDADALISLPPPPPPPPAAFAIPCYMAALARGAPLPGGRALVADPQSQQMVQRSRSLTEKILLSVPDAHRSCVHTEVSEDAWVGP